MVLEAELAVGVVADEGQVFGQQRDGLDEGRGVAFGALDSIVHVYPIAAGLTERVAAEYEQPRDVELLIELFLAVRAEHLTTNNRIILRGHITRRAARCRTTASSIALPSHAGARTAISCSRWRKCRRS